jgi:hypothetical protein
MENIIHKIIERIAPPIPSPHQEDQSKPSNWGVLSEYRFNLLYLKYFQHYLLISSQNINPNL